MNSTSDAEDATVTLSVKYHTSFVTLYRKISELLNKPTFYSLKLWYFDVHDHWSPLESERDWEKAKGQRQDTASNFTPLDFLYSVCLNTSSSPDVTPRQQGHGPLSRSSIEKGKSSFFMMTSKKNDAFQNTESDPVKLNIMAKTLEQRIISGGY